MKKDNYKWIALSCTTIGALMSVMSGSTLIVALPDIMTELKAGMGTVTWILMGYMLVLTILVPSIGRIADIFGRKKLYVSGFAIFTVSSLFCAWAHTGNQLLVFRLVQAVGGSFMVANSTAIVADAFPKNELGKALGINSMFISIGSVIGPILGGFLVSVGWRNIFYLNLPIGVIGTLWAGLQLKETLKPEQGQKIDWPGTLTFSTSLLALLIALTLGSFGEWTSSTVKILFAVALVTMGAFVKIENGTDQPMLDMRLLKTKVLAFAYASNFFNGLARGAVTFLIIFYLQGIKSIDPITAGIFLTPFAISMLIVSPISGHLSDKYGARILSSVGLLISAAGLAGLMFITAGTPILELMAWMFIMGIGSGLFFSPNTNAIMGAVPMNKRGIAAGMRTMLMNAGNVLSIAFSMAIIGSSVSPEAMQGLFTGTQVGSQGIAVSAFIGGLRMAFAISFAFSVIGAALSFMRGPEPVWENPDLQKAV
jgi:EmrB/QacA subfamily drug resistance transporter